MDPQNQNLVLNHSGILKEKSENKEVNPGFKAWHSDA